MKIAKCLPTLRSALLFGSLYFGTIAAWQFWSARPLYSGCIPIGSHSEHFFAWIRNHRSESILAYVGGKTLMIIAVYSAGLTALACGLIWSLKRQGLLRPRLSVRSLMVAVAVVAVLLGGWNSTLETWDRWLLYEELAKRYETRESNFLARQELVDWGFTGDTIDEMLRRNARQREICRKWKDAYREAVRTPWIEMKPSEELEATRSEIRYF